MPNVVALSRFRADLSRSLARQGAQLMERDDLHELVPRIEPLDAYFLIKEVGVEDALPLLRHCTPEQLQACVDLDCWSDDRPDPEALDAWLAAFAQLGQTELAEAFYRLDGELQVIYLARSLVIHEAYLADDLPDPPEGVVRHNTPDRYFLVEPRPSEEREFDLYQLVEAIYARDTNEGFRLMTAALWEQVAILEEDALRFRVGRMEDLGFPARDTAMSLFARPAKQPMLRPSTPPVPQQLPALYAAAVAQDSLLAAALDGVQDDAAVRRLEHELRCLVNYAVVAYDKPPSAHFGGQLAQHVRDTLSLGLEVLLELDTVDWRPRVPAAAELLLVWPLIEIFRYGHCEFQPVIANAQALLKHGRAATWYAVPESQQDDYGGDRLDREFVAALLRKPPMESGFDPIAPKAQRPFASRLQVRDAAERLEEIRKRFAGGHDQL